MQAPEPDSRTRRSVRGLPPPCLAIRPVRLGPWTQRILSGPDAPCDRGVPAVCHAPMADVD